jgi:parallel beta-helix repeat protein
VRKTTALLLVLLTVSSLLLVRTAFGNSILNRASTANITAPVTVYNNSPPESSLEPINPIIPTPISKLTPGIADDNVTRIACDRSVPEPASEPAYEFLDTAYEITTPEPTVMLASNSLDTVYGNPAPESAITPEHVPTPVAADESPGLDYDNPTPEPEIATEPTPKSIDDTSELSTIPAIVVAASNSPHQNEADFICDGFDDQKEIQAAIDALEGSGGGTLIFRKGDYYLSPEGDYCLYLPGNLTFEGEAGASTEDIRLLLAREPDRGIFETKEWSWSPPWVSTDNISFKNLTIDIGSPNGFLREYPEGNYWQDFFVIAATSDNFLLDNVSFVQDNPDSIVSRLFLHQCDNVVIQNCEFEGTVVHCFHNGRMLDEPKIMLNEGMFLFQNNTMRNTPSGVCPAVCGDMNKFTALDNEFYNLGGTAIDIGISTGALIEGNEIHGARLCGIYSEGGHDIVIRNNYIEDVGYNNPADPWDGFGIWTADCRHYRYGGNVLIEDNIIRNCGRGIASSGTPGITISHNDIQGLDANGISLSFLAESGVNYDGIPSFADDSEVVNNKIIDFGRNYPWSRGIILHNVVGIKVSGNLVDGNDNPGAIQGIAEYRSQLCVCPDCGWIFGPDWKTGLTCEERTCPECGASLQAWLAQERPDYNSISNNEIQGVGQPLVVVGAHSTAD